MDMDDYLNGFGNRLVQLRVQKEVSAREMSLALGQSHNYINSIESGKSYPSMKMLMYICEYLGITPADFFNYNIDAPIEMTELIEIALGMNFKARESLIAFLRAVNK